LVPDRRGLAAAPAAQPRPGGRDASRAVRAEGEITDRRSAQQGAESLSLYASGAWTDATYTDYPAAACGLEHITLPSCDLTGGQVAGVPKFAWSGGGEYRAPTAVGELFVGLDYSYRSKIGSTGNSRYTELEGRGLLNARVGIRSAEGGWTAYVWSRNLLDEEYLTTKVPIGNNGGLFSNVGDPRTVGATLRVDF